MENNKLMTVFLHGVLGKKFRKEWRLNVSSAREAIHAININTGGKLKAFLLQNNTVFYQVVFGDKSMCVIEELEAKIEKVNELHIVPHIVGASANMISTVAGAVLLVAGAVLMFFPGFQPVGVLLMLGGASLLAQGIIGLLSPQPKPDEYAKKGGRSFLLDPSINTIRNGDPLPVAYGRLMIPGLSIDNRLETEDVDD